MNKNITINILPQSPEAWAAIAISVMFICFALMVRGCADMEARQAEAKYRAGSEMVKSIQK